MARTRRRHATVSAALLGGWRHLGRIGIEQQQHAIAAAEEDMAAFGAAG